MNEDPLQTIYYTITKLGYNDKTAQYFINRYKKDLLKLMQEANKLAEEYKNDLLKISIKNYINNPNRLNPEYH